MICLLLECVMRVLSLLLSFMLFHGFAVKKKLFSYIFLYIKNMSIFW